MERRIADRGRLAVALARLGVRDEAAQINEELRALDEPYLFGEHMVWQAKIAASHGDSAAAVDLLRVALDQGITIAFHWRTLTQWHRDPAFESLWDYGPFNDFMTLQE